jgi:hypothetical protein
MEGKMHEGFPLLEYILTLKDEACFYVELPDYNGKNIRKPLSVRNLKAQLSVFPALISKFKDKIILNLTRFRNGGFTN